MRALIAVDVQNDFVPGGSLAVPKGDAIIPVINNIMSTFDIVVATQDWHPKNHMSFATNHPNKKPFETIMIDGHEQTLWPEHCVNGSFGAEFCSSLNQDSFAAIFRKGMNPNVDSYSGFYDNQRAHTTGLSGYLKEKGVSELYLSGLCADICVYYTLMDALSEGFKCSVVLDATVALDENRFIEIQKELSDKVNFVSSESISLL